MRVIALALVLSAPSFAVAQSMPHPALDAIRALAAAGTEPIVADMSNATTPSTTVAAIAQLTSTSAAIMIAAELKPGEFGVVARSKVFSLSRDTNFGAWVEEFRFAPPDRIELSFSTPNGCARTLATHRFVLRKGTWLASGLDRSAMRCTENGVEQDWTESANYLTGKVVRTTFAPLRPPRTVQLRTTRRSFPLSEFPPSGPESIYAEMQ